MTRFFCLSLFLLAGLSMSLPTYAVAHTEKQGEPENVQSPLSRHDKRWNPHLEHRNPYEGYRPHSDFSMGGHKSDIMGQDSKENVKAPLSQHDKRWNPHLQTW
jgi:hypothetical protein